MGITFNPLIQSGFDFTGSSGGGGGGANTSLSNLTSPTAINQALTFGSGIAGSLSTFSPAININSQNLSISTGNVTGSGIQGNIQLLSSNFILSLNQNVNVWGGPTPAFLIDSSLNGTDSDVFVLGSTDTSSASIATTYVYLLSGDNLAVGATAPTGGLYIASGNIIDATATANSGNLLIGTGGVAGSGTSGPVSLGSGQTNTGISGDVSLSSGFSTTGATGKVLISTGTTSGTRGSIQFQDGSQGTIGQLWISKDTSGSGHWANLSASSAFINYASTQVTTRSSIVSTSPGFSTANNSPAFTFTPTISGIYKVYTSGGLLSDTAGGAPACRVFNTSGGATLLQESQGISYSSAGSAESSASCQSVYSLTAGTTYQFDIQLGGPSNANAQLDGTLAPFYMFAEGIGLTGAFNSSTTTWNNNLSFTTSAWGTITSPDFRYRVVGDSLEVRGNFIVGTPAVAIASINLPLGYLIDTVKLASTAGGQVIGSLIRTAGAALAGTSSGPWALFYDGSTNNKIFYTLNPAQGTLSKNNGNDGFASGDGAQFYFSVPIKGLFGSGIDGVSNIAKSNSSGVFNFSNVLVPVTDGVNPLKAVITTNGGDVEIGLQADGSANPSYVITDTTPTDSSGTVNFYRDGILIASQFMYMQNNISIEIHGIPSSSFKYIDSPPAGTHTYTVQVVGGVNRGDQAVNYSVLYAKPLSALAGGSGSSTGPYAQAFFGPTSGWSTTSAAYVDGTNAGGNALTIRRSSGIVLTAAAGNVCGVTFTPPTSDAVYLITATFPFQNTLTDATGVAKLTDGTEDISTGMYNNTNTGNDVIVPITLSGIYIPGVNTPVTVKLQLAAVAGSGTSKINNIGATSLANAVEWTVTQLSNGSGPSVWTPYTPTFTGMGTVTGATFWYKYDGADSIHIKGTWTTGTPTATQAQLSLPTGFISNSTKINGTIESCGTMNHNNPNSVAFAVTIQPAVSYVTFGYNTNTGGDLNPDLGNVVFATGATYSFTTSSIPIS